MSTNPAESISLHLLHDDSLSRSDVDSLRAIVASAGGSFEAISVDGGRPQDLAKSDRFPVRIWYRVLLPELLPDLGRVLYIDADAIVTGRLGALWQTELADCLLGAVTNPLYETMVPRVQSELGLADGDGYFNSGVLLIDLDGWRAAWTGSAVLRFAACHPALIWPDQDALNGVLHERRLRLHPRWNAMPGIWALPRRYLPYTTQEVDEAAAEPAIVHFVGDHKPWHYRCRHPYRAEYFRYLEQTPWRGRPIEGRSAWQAVLRPLPQAWAYRVEGAVERPQHAVSSARSRVRARVGRPA